MDDAKCELVREWLERAQLDLATARRLGAGDDPLWEVAGDHDPVLIRSLVLRAWQGSLV